jgi:hypothetical protein
MLSPGFENLSVEELKKYIEAQEEKSHMQILANAIGQCPGMSGA